MTPDRHTLFVQPYHPDVLRQPVPLFNAAARDRQRVALVWNTFRTLEQIAPPFWLRRLVARLHGLPPGGTGAPQTVRVSCWRDLPLTPQACLRRARHGTVSVDAFIETEESVVALACPADDRLPVLASDTADGNLLDVVEAMSWAAGSRRLYAGVVLPPEGDPQRWEARLTHRARTVMRLLAGDSLTANVRGIGVTTWPAIAALVDEVAEAGVLDARERQIGAETARWLQRGLGTVPAAAARRRA